MGSLVKFPGLGSASAIVSSPVKPMDVAVGVAAGFAGAAALKVGAEKAGFALPAIATATPLVGGAATGLLLYLLEKKKNRTRAAGHAVGAALGGLIVWGYQMLQTSGLPGFSDIRTLPGGYGGPIFQNPRTQMLGFGGPIFQNPRNNMAAIGRLQGFGDDNEDGLFPAP